jgi:hypothetical protein
VCLPVTLARKKGNAIASRSVDVGLGGMCVSVERPLTVDEALSFELVLDDGSRIAGRARVLREQTHRVYALGFERLPPDAMDGLTRLCAPVAAESGARG